MIERLVTAIRTCDPDASSVDIADVLWLAGFLGPGSSQAPPSADQARPVARTGESRPDEAGSPAEALRPPPYPETARKSPPPPSGEQASFRLPPEQPKQAVQGVFARSPAVPAIPDQLALARSLRPLGRKVLSRKWFELDEDRTSELVADTGLWIPAIRPQAERWLDVALVVDSSASMAVWEQTIVELRWVLERAGIFPDVRLWHVDTDVSGQPLLRSELGRDRAGRHPAELIDPAGRRLVLVVTDCVGQAWGNGAMGRVLERWARSGPVAIVQLLPQRLWVDCVPEFFAVQLYNLLPGAPNARWSVHLADEVERDLFETDSSSMGVPIPVLQLDPRWLSRWSTLVAGNSPGPVHSTVLFTSMMSEVDGQLPEPVSYLAATDRVKRFRARASPEAYQLAVYLSSAPLSLPVMRLVQQVMVPESKPSHLAEVFLSDLLRSNVPEERKRRLNADEVEYDFVPGVRGELHGQLSRTEALQVLSHVSKFVSRHLGSVKDFSALLTLDSPHEPLGFSRPFAQVAHDVLRSMGGRYGELARRLRRLGGVKDKERMAELPPITPSDAPHQRDQHHGAAVSQTVQSSAPVEARRLENEPVAIEPVIIRGLPPRNPHFTGRTKMLDDLHGLLQSSSENTALLPHTVHGLGGVGKTQLAVEYVYRFANEYDLVYWISAENTEQVRTSLAKLGQIMRLPESVDVSQTVESVLDALRTLHPFRRWLLVFDNADEPNDLLQFLPVPNGHVLITSRNPGWTEVARTMEVDVLHRDESVELLRRRARHITSDDANELAERLGDLPLALEQAAAWQAETGMSVREYLELFDDKLQLLTDRGPAGYPDTLAATWQLSFDRLRDQSPEAALLLEVCAFLGPEPIPVNLFWAGRHAELPAGLVPAVRDNIRLRRALREIIRYALAKMDPVTDKISVHRLVQAVLRANMSPETRTVNMRAARRLLAAANPSEPDDVATWPMHEQLSPHIVPSGVIESADELTRKVVLDQLRYRYMRGDYEGSRDLGELVVKVWQEKWGLEDVMTLIARRHLANTLRVLGDSERAYALNEETLAKMRETLGPDHEHTLATADTFGADMRRRGLFQQAKESDEDNLARHVRVYGDGDPATVRIASNLAVSFRLLGEAQRAYELDRSSLRRLREIFGDNHKRTLFSISNNVRNLLGMGDYTRALRMQEDVFPAHQELLGQRHSDVLLAARNIVIGLRKTGQYDLAESRALDHLDRCRQRLGLNHEHTLAAMTSYGNALRDNTKLSLARQTLDEAFDRYSETFGPRHPFTLACSINRAIVLRKMDDYQAALAMNERNRAELIAVLGADHPAVLCCETNLGNDLAMLHEHNRARELSAATLERSLLIRGENHPYTFACAVNAALDLKSTGDTEAGTAAFDQALAELARLLGDRHPEVEAIGHGSRADADIEVSPT